jgi:hypothetical protein
MAKSKHANKADAKKANRKGGLREVVKVEAAGVRAPKDASLKRELVAVERILPRYPDNTPAEVTAFVALTTDDRKSSLGGQTKAINVLREAIAVVVAIDAAFRAYSAAVIEHYSLSRFRFLLGRIVLLGGALGAPVKGAGRGEVRRPASNGAGRHRCRGQRRRRHRRSAHRPD